jgi:hypothetical protein
MPRAKTHSREDRTPSRLAQGARNTLHASLGRVLIAVLCCLGAAAVRAAPPETLSLADLVNRPDRWPATLTLKRDFQFSNGNAVHQGEQLHIQRFDGAHLFVATLSNHLFGAAPEDCGLLESANQAWAALTPAQRAIDPESLAGDFSLWPATVATTAPIGSKFGRLPSGTQVRLISVTSKGMDIAWPNPPGRISIDFGSADLFARARQLALLDPAQRPSRVAAALEGLLVDADGAAYRDEHLGEKKFFALYFGANWCAPCHAFSPDFVKFLNDALPRHPELAVAMLSNDEDPAQMYAYMKAEKMPFPAVPLKALNGSGLLSSYAVKMIPHLVIVDRFGNILASNDDDTGNRADPRETIDALRKLLGEPGA